VYVNGLPEDVTEEDFIELMSKCGVIDIDARLKSIISVKLYLIDGSIFSGHKLAP
jgi:RNA recognition motif-containing protein